MKIRIIGGGPIGCLLAAKLTRHSGKQAYIELIARGAKQRDELMASGVRLSEGENSTAVRIRCRSYSDGLLNDSADWTLLTVKQFHIDEQLLQVLEQGHRQDRIICFQNGIGHLERIAERIGADKLYAAVTTEGALKESNTSVRHTGVGTTWIGPVYEHIDTSAGEKSEKKLVKLLRNAGFEVFLSKNINKFIWQKLLINSVVNPLTALLRIRNGQLLESPEWMALMYALLHEGNLLAEASGITPDRHSWEHLIQVCERTAENRSSMLQDVENGKATELDWITGEMLKRGKSLGIPMPTHETVYQLLKGLEHLTNYR